MFETYKRSDQSNQRDPESLRSFEEHNQSRGSQKHSQERAPLFSSSSSGRQYETFNVKDEGSTADIQTMKELAQNRRQGLELVLDYYHKHQRFSGGVDEDWLGHLHQFNALADEYESPASTRLTHFKHSLKPTSQAFQYYMKFRAMDTTTWNSMIHDIQERYHSDSKRARASRQLHGLTFDCFEKSAKTASEALRLLLT